MHASLRSDDALSSQPPVTLDRFEESFARQGRLPCLIPFTIMNYIRTMALGVTDPPSIVITRAHLQVLSRTIIVRAVLLTPEYICIKHRSGGGEIRTLDAHKAHTGFRDQPIQPL
jgi:hypothetical protein